MGTRPLHPGSPSARSDLSERTRSLRGFGRQSVDVQKGVPNQGELEVDSPNGGIFTGLVLHPWAAGHVRLQEHI